MSEQDNSVDAHALLRELQTWGRELGFAHIGVSDLDLSRAEVGLARWLAAGFQGTMDYMARHGSKRTRPAELVPGTISVITARMNYLPRDTPHDWQRVEWQRLRNPREGVVSVYARGRDYHKVVRSRLQKLQRKLAERVGPFGHRVFSDSAPVMEGELAARSGQGWGGKHSLILSRDAGSMFFLGEIYVDLALPATAPVSNHCGSCSACLDVCPTGAIIAPGVVDARRCISYLTIEHHGSIDEALRPLMSNHVYGCDDCQVACPWNKYAQPTELPDFDVRDGLRGSDLTALFAWTEAEFLARTEGNPLRRIGHVRWLRNVAIALGNALRALPAGDPQAAELRAALHARQDHPSDIVREHVAWALAQDNG